MAETIRDKPASTTPDPPQRLWFIEIWVDKRKVFKELVAHIVFFGVFVGILEGFHRILNVSTLPAEELRLLNKVHFYTYAVSLVIFAVMFIIKVLYWEGKGLRK